MAADPVVTERRRTVRRVFTGTNAAGEAVIARDELIEPSAHRSPSRGFEILKMKLPATLDAEPDVDVWTKPYPDPDGIHVKVTETAPGLEIPMHRRDMIDVIFVLSGEITAIMDGGDETTLAPGDVFVQFGTNHTWEVRGDQPCRVGIVNLGVREASG